MNALLDETTDLLLVREEQFNDLGQALPGKAFLPIIRHDLKPLCINRKVIIDSKDINKMDLYLGPLIDIFPGRIIYICSEDERSSCNAIRNVPLYTVADLPYVKSFEKIVISLESKSPTNTEIGKVYDFIRDNSNSKTFVIVNDAYTVMNDFIPDIIKDGPGKCILIFQRQEQLSFFCNNDSLKMEKELLRNFWAVINMRDYKE